MIDTHCHLTDPRLFSQLDGVILRARVVGVVRMITVGTELRDARAAIELCRGQMDVVRCAVGIHPNYSQEAAVADVADNKDRPGSPGVVGFLASAWKPTTGLPARSCFHLSKGGFP